MSAVLLIAADLADAPGLPALRERLQARGAASVVLSGPIAPRALLAALRGLAADPARSWLATRDATAALTAATAGLHGVVVIGSGTDRDDAVLVRHSPDLDGIPIAMVPRDGGCWHDQRPGG